MQGKMGGSKPAETVKVVVRVRPMSEKEIANGHQRLEVGKKQIMLDSGFPVSA